MSEVESTDEGKADDASVAIENTDSGWEDPRPADRREAAGARERLRARLLGEAGDGSLTIGRFHLIKRIGVGGMGTVYSAHDELLDRKVALKVIRGEPSPDRRARMLREAQAMAKLNHPNVVAIYEIGELDDELHIAMEFIRGVTLRSWMGNRSWREVLDVFVQAGRGLTAAHAAGLVHRDFKPENVMVDEDGRARVLDFGLVQQDTSVERVALDDTMLAAAVKPFASTLTTTGARLGTPAYMAPEHFTAGAIDTLTDQFSFCVALYEALYRERPFTGPNLAALVASITKGEIGKRSSSANVPGWLRSIVVRGLRVAKQERWPSMKALCDALARGAGRRRRRIAFASAAAVATGLLVAWGGVELDRERRRAQCSSEGEVIAEVWNDDARARLRAALVGTGPQYAEVTADKVMPWLDEHAKQWRAARTDACLDARVEGTWSDDMLDRAVWCLDERAMELSALVEELTQAQAVDKAVQSAADLTAVAPCRDADTLTRLPASPTAEREAVRAVRADLSRAGALLAIAAYDDGLALARTAHERAESLSWPPLAAAARLRVGSLLAKKGEYAKAERELETAFFAAAQHGATEVAVAAADHLVLTVGYQQARHAEGFRWSRHAELLLPGLPDVAGIRQAAHLNNVAFVHAAAGDVDEAVALLERALALREAALGPAHPAVAMSLNNLGAVDTMAGAHGDAMTAYARALAIWEAALGPEHPDVASGLNNVAAVHSAIGEHEQAKALYERALAIKENALGPAHADVGACLNNLANVHWAMGDYDGASTVYARALAIREQALGPDHPDVAQALNNLASVRNAVGAHDDARELYARAIAIKEKALGPDHVSVASSVYNLGELHRATGAYADANALLERALAIWEAGLGPDHLDAARALVGLAEVALAEGRVEEAVALAERASAVRERGDAPAPDLAEARWVLARALSSSDRSRALALAEQARDAYRSAGNAHADVLADVERWLASPQ